MGSRFFISGAFLAACGLSLAGCSSKPTSTTKAPDPAAQNAAVPNEPNDPVAATDPAADRDVLAEQAAAYAAKLEAVLANDGRVAPIVNDGIYICVRHGANSWRLRFDAIQGPPGWTEVANPNFLPAADLAFYRSLSSGGVPAAY